MQPFSVFVRTQNMPRFPKMNGGNFPHLDTVDVNQWQNDFDYSRYDATQMKLTVCSVPWDMGEAHIGNRTISGIGNVVYFGSKESRDAWFDAIPDNECYRWETKYKELHRDQFIDVALPFDVAAKYNYLAVEYSLFANDDSPVMYEREDGHRKWFWFIREVEFVAPNTTRLHLIDDAFQTWIYDVNVTGMILERGHAPMFETNATKYLADPIDNAAGLLTEDVNYGELRSRARLANSYSIAAACTPSSSLRQARAVRGDRSRQAHGTRQGCLPATRCRACPHMTLSPCLRRTCQRCWATPRAARRSSSRRSRQLRSFPETF